MKNYLFIIFALILFSCTSEEIGFIEDNDLTSSTRMATVDEVEELELTQGALDYLKVVDALIPKVLKATDEVKYPDYYGGASINDKGRLIILVTEKPGYYKQIFRKIIGHKDLDVRKCEYSLNQLKDCMKAVDLSRDNNPECFSDISNLYYISDSKNKVIVTLKKFNEAGIEEFKSKVNNFKGIEFAESEGELYLAAELNPGMPILMIHPQKTGGSSMGFRDRKNGVPGMVVSGHASLNGGNYFTDNGPVDFFGTCSVPIIGGPVDCAFVPVDVGTPSNKIFGSQNILSAQTNSPGEGTFVNFRGRYIANGGTIYDTGASATFKDKDNPSREYKYTNLTSVNLATPVQNGDSGGIVYSYVSSTNTRYNLGNIVGYASESGRSFYGKTSYIVSYLGVTLY